MIHTTERRYKNLVHSFYFVEQSLPKRLPALFWLRSSYADPREVVPDGFRLVYCNWQRTLLTDLTLPVSELQGRLGKKDAYEIRRGQRDMETTPVWRIHRPTLHTRDLSEVVAAFLRHRNIENTSVAQLEQDDSRSYWMSGYITLHDIPVIVRTYICDSSAGIVSSRYVVALDIPVEQRESGKYFGRLLAWNDMRRVVTGSMIGEASVGTVSWLE